MEYVLKVIQCTVILWIFMMIQLKSIVKEYYTFSVCGGLFLFKNRHQEVRMMSPEEKWDPLGASLQENRKFQGPQRTPGEKLQQRTPTRARKTDERMRKQTEFDKKNLAEAREGSEELARIQKVISEWHSYCSGLVWIATILLKHILTYSHVLNHG